MPLRTGIVSHVNCTLSNLLESPIPRAKVTKASLMIKVDWSISTKKTAYTRHFNPVFSLDKALLKAKE
jgi:hypothetical protein